MAKTKLCPSCEREVSFFAFTRDGACEDCIARYGRDWNGASAARLASIEEEIFARTVAGQSIDWRGMPDEVVTRYASAIPITTGLEIPRREIARIVTIVGGEAALGLNLFRDVANAVRDTFGGRSETLQKALRVARELCTAELKREALFAGGDAVVAVSFDYSEFSSSAVTGGMVLAAATGTAVRLEPSGAIEH